MNTENNKLIAVFDGWELSPYPNLPDKVYKEDEEKEEIGIPITQLNYDEDLNLLIGIVEKIEDCQILSPVGMNVNSYNNVAVIKCRWKGTVIAIGKGKTRRQALYFAVVEFITWYNKQQPKK